MARQQPHNNVKPACDNLQSAAAGAAGDALQTGTKCPAMAAAAATIEQHIRDIVYLSVTQTVGTNPVSAAVFFRCENLVEAMEKHTRLEGLIGSDGTCVGPVIMFKNVKGKFLTIFLDFSNNSNNIIYVYFL